ncbi:hypothetical protein [Nonomuraea lactucae]|uniref:hypothetical protein n=1 Tax=Nonomuraea lactucae TaxID=2249762 RepID=UPI000DE54243|nr:hypothetical protein [Nonomuraea lactucae]
MKPIVVNRAVLEQTSFDSATPAGTSVTVHRFDQDGRFEVAVLRDDAMVDRMWLTVTGSQEPRPDQAATARHAGEVVAGITVDLAAIPGRHPDERRLDTRISGYVAFTSSAHQSHHRVVVTREGEQRPEFDSNLLRNGDLFAATLIRPGRYVATNTATGAQAEIRVGYPQIGRTPYVPPEPHTVESGRGFSEDRITLAPAQGIVFHISADSHITIDLVEPDNGPSPGPRPKARWFKPQRPESTQAQG